MFYTCTGFYYLVRRHPDHTGDFYFPLDCAKEIIRLRLGQSTSMGAFPLTPLPRSPLATGGMLATVPSQTHLQSQWLRPHLCLNRWAAGIRRSNLAMLSRDSREWC